MKTFKRFQDLIAWQKARELTKQVYAISKSEQFYKDFGMRSQIQRASVSIMSNIAEGYARGAPNQFKHFLDISWGSAAEVQSLLYVAVDQDYINSHQFNHLFQLSDETISLIAGLKRSINKSNTPKKQSP